MPVWKSIDELALNIVPIFTAGRNARRFRSVEGTGFLLDGLLLTCWHCTRAPLQDEMMYGFCQGVRIISLRHMGVPIETFTRIDEMDLVVTRVPFSNSLRFRLSKAGPQTGDEVWTFGYPLSDRADTPEGGFTLHPRVFKGHVLRTFTYEHHQFGPTPSLELSFPVPPGLSGAPIVRANSLKIVGMAYGNNDVQLVEELSTTDPETGSRKPEVSRIIPFGLAHPLHILQRAVSVGYSLPVDEE